ncbi:MAG: patatin-like phospholipase family protein [Phycisphaeraceae bacterium]|nr:patatin-like phospholipase family protein [Phycisphaeraceae bacterium]
MTIWRRIVLVAVLAGVPAGCVVNRPTLEPEELDRRRVSYLREVADEREAGIQKIVRRWTREYEEYASGKTAEPPVFDVLVISGGGDKGAFGAGFLEGWGTVQGELARPEFDVVSGVSTGALIAPFAFIGSGTSYERILKLYQDPSDDWIKLRGLFFFLPGSTSFYDNSGLARDIRREINDEVIAELAKGSEQDRVLAIGTTNLDLSMERTWDLGDQAQLALAVQDADRVHRILLASAAIPAAFPPVVIDDTLYVDGGTTANILIVTDLRADDTPRNVLRRDHPGVPIPKMRYWVVINNQLDARPQIVQPSWVSITAGSVETTVRSSTNTALRYFAQQVDYVRLAEGIDVELRYVSIPQSWRAPKTGLFQKETMQSLSEMGRRMGADPASWRMDLAATKLPGELLEEVTSEQEAVEVLPEERPAE